MNKYGDIKVFDTEPTLEEMQSVVGGMVEAVYLENGDVLIINENGKLLELPLNEIATKIFHDNGGDILDGIVGDVAIVPKEFWK